jgi:hypothetical protein
MLKMSVFIRRQLVLLIVKEFLEELQPLTKRKKNPPLAFLVQSGFPEGLHSRYVEGYLMAVADRLNSPYLGTLVRGGCEGVRMQPEKMNRAMFAVLNDLGRQLAEEGGFEQESIDAFNKRERTLPLTMPRMKWLENRPFAKMYWDIQLIMNKVYKKRFARPYAEPGR